MDDVDAVLEAMAERGVTRAELARMLGVRPPVVTQMLGRRQSAMGADRLARVMDALGYDLVFVPKGRRLPEGAKVYGGPRG